MPITVVPGKPDVPEPSVSALIADLSARGLTLAIAESLTGGLLTADFVRPAGASSVVVGGVVAYDTAIKASVLGVDSDLLEREGPVHPEVARQMADRVRNALAVDGRPADLGLSTTGVAGPDPQDDAEVGTVFVGIATADAVDVVTLNLTGTRDQIRARTVSEAIAALAERV
jgi:nicotinamide-nucleotide amidase